MMKLYKKIMMSILLMVGIVANSFAVTDLSEVTDLTVSINLEGSGSLFGQTIIGDGQSDATSLIVTKDGDSYTFVFKDVPFNASGKNIKLGDITVSGLSKTNDNNVDVYTGSAVSISSSELGDMNNSLFSAKFTEEGVLSGDFTTSFNYSLGMGMNVPITVKADFAQSIKAEEPSVFYSFKSVPYYNSVAVITNGTVGPKQDVNKSKVDMDLALTSTTLDITIPTYKLSLNSDLEVECDLKVEGAAYSKTVNSKGDTVLSVTNSKVKVYVTYVDPSGGKMDFTLYGFEDAVFDPKNNTLDGKIEGIEFNAFTRGQYSIDIYFGEQAQEKEISKKDFDFDFNSARELLVETKDESVSSAFYSETDSVLVLYPVNVSGISQKVAIKVKLDSITDGSFLKYERTFIASRKTAEVYLLNSGEWTYVADYSVRLSCTITDPENNYLVGSVDVTGFNYSAMFLDKDGLHEVESEETLVLKVDTVMNTVKSSTVKLEYWDYVDGSIVVAYSMKDVKVSDLDLNATTTTVTVSDKDGNETKRLVNIAYEYETYTYSFYSEDSKFTLVGEDTVIYLPKFKATLINSSLDSVSAVNYLQSVTVDIDGSVSTYESDFDKIKITVKSGESVVITCTFDPSLSSDNVFTSKVIFKSYSSKVKFNKSECEKLNAVYSDGVLSVTGLNSNKLTTIISLTGTEVKTFSGNSTDVMLKKGVYILKNDNKAVKFIVK